MATTTTNALASPPRLLRWSPGGAPRSLIALSFGVVLAELAIAATIVDERLLPLLVVVVGAAALALMFRLPLAGGALLLVLTDSLFHESFFGFDLGGLAVRPHELVLAGLLLVAAVRPKRQSWGGIPGGALAIFLALVLLSALLGVADGRADLTEAVSWGRPFLLLMFFYVVVRLFPTRAEVHRLLTVAAVVGAITALVALVVAFGSELGALLQDPGRQFVRTEEGLGVIKRVRLPGLALAYVLFWYLATRALERRGEQRLFWLALLACSSVGILFSFNRNMWLGIGFGLVITLVVARVGVRHRLAAALAVAAAGLVLMFFLGANAGQGSRLEPLVERGSTLLDPTSVGEESSLTTRRRETELAWAAAVSHPVVGIGAGATYGFFWNEPRTATSYLRQPQRFLHNQYLYLVLVAGFPGAIAFLVFLGATLRRAWRRATGDPAVAALGVGLATVMLSAIVMLYFSVWDMTAAIGLVTGAIVAATEQRGPPAAPDAA